MTLRSGNSSAEVEQILQVMRAIAESGNSECKNLPPEAFNSREIFELEKKKIFDPGWILLGRTDQVARPGDYMCVDVLDEPLVMVRDGKGVLHVLSRVCRHRWADVCQGSGNTSRFVCPYHLWSYELDGRLRAAPEMKGAPGFDKSSIRLPEVRHEVWEGFVFVNLSGTADPLAERLAPLEPYIREYDLPSWKVVATRDWGELPWDWKVFQDNGDCYHHMGLHKESVEPTWPASTSWDVKNNGHFTLVYCGTNKDRLVRADDGELIMEPLFPPKPGLTATQRTNLLLFYVLPNFFISPFPYWGIVCRVFPLGPGRIHFYHDIMVPPEAMAQPDFQEKVAIADKFFSDVNEEDVRVCTAVQRCLESRYAQRGSLGRLEGHNRDFTLWVARQLTA